MKKIIIAAFAAVLLFALSGAASAADGSEIVNVIVEVESIELLTDIATDVLTLAGENARVLYTYDVLLCGFSVNVPRETLDEIAALPHVVSVGLSNLYMRAGAENDSDTSAVAAERALSAYDGSGTAIAVIDSSFDVSHEVFAGERDGYKYKKSDIDARRDTLHAGGDSYISPKIPFAYDYFAMDTDVYTDNTHGTSVAALIAAERGETRDGFDGAAPGSQLLLLRVFPALGSYTTDAVVLAALEDAVTLGADVINFSLTEAVGVSKESGYLFDLGCIIDKITALGIPFVAPAGNCGKTGVGSFYDMSYGISDPLTSMVDTGSVSFPASVPSAFAAASVDNILVYSEYITQNETKIQIKDSSPSFIDLSFAEVLDGRELEYVPVGGVGAPSDFAAAGDLTGKLALVARGQLTFVEKINNAAAAGAVGVIVTDNVSQKTPSVSMEMTGAQIPAVLVTMADGELLLSADDKTVKIKADSRAAFAVADRVTVSDISARGPTTDLRLKPEITAVGGVVYSAATDDEYSFFSGTSYAAANVSGALAVLIQKLRESGTAYTPEYLKMLLMSTAVPLASDGGGEVPPRLQGAGCLDVGRALCASGLLSGTDGEVKAELSDRVGRTFVLKVRVTNPTEERRSYNLTASLASCGFYTEQLFYDNAKGSFASEEAVVFDKALIRVGDGSANINRYAAAAVPCRVTLDGGESAALSLTFHMDADDMKKYGKAFENGFFLEGYVFLDTDNGEPCSSLPFIGVCGDTRRLSVFDVSDYTATSFFGNNLFFSNVSDSELVSQQALGGSIYNNLEPYAAEKVAFSPNGDGQADRLYLSLGLLRDVRSISYSVRNSSGAVVYSSGEMGKMKKTSFVNGSLHSFDFPVWDARAEDYKRYVYPDGAYTVTVTATPAVPGAAAQSLTLPFAVDTKKPEMTGCSVKQTAVGRYLTVELTDASGIQGAELYTVKYGSQRGSSQTKPLSGKPGTVVLTFDISGIYEKYIYLRVIDNAFNTAVLRIEPDMLF